MDVGCRLAQTYQTFFQLHLLYVLMLTVRLRVLPAQGQSDWDAFNPPRQVLHNPADPSADPIVVAEPKERSDSKPFFFKPHYSAYPASLVNHFFELAESQMRRVLGRGERESYIKKLMREMGEQWRGSGYGLDYVLGLSSSDDPVERERADSELASWIWRNMMDAKGLSVPANSTTPPAADLDLAENLETVVRFVRREMARLDQISDSDVLGGRIGEWGLVQTA